MNTTLARLALASTMGAAMYFGASPASAEPPVTAGLKLYLDASLLTDLSDGATVTTWTDMSGNGNNATAAGTPIYKTSALNGEPVIRFNNPQWANNASFTTADLSSQFPTAATLFIAATRYAQPLLAMLGRGQAPSGQSLLTVASTAVTVTGLKPADDGGGLILRLFNTSEKPAEATLSKQSLQFYLSSTTEEAGKRIERNHLTFKPFELMTIRGE